MLLPPIALVSALLQLVFDFNTNIYIDIDERYGLLILFSTTIIAFLYTILRVIVLTVTKTVLKLLNSYLEPNRLKSIILEHKKTAADEYDILKCLCEQENMRFKKAMSEYTDILERLNAKYPGLKAVDYNVMNYSYMIFKSECDGFIEVLQKIIHECNQRHTREWWFKISPKQFEQEVANWFVMKGYNAIVTKYSGDGGVDIILQKDGDMEYVQCKQYQNHVQVGTIRELYGVMASDGIKHGYIVSLYGLTEKAMDFACKNNISSITLDDLIKNNIHYFYNSNVKEIGIGVWVGECFLFADVYNKLNSAQKTITNRFANKGSWLFVLKNVDYYAICLAPEYMKNELELFKKYVF